MVGRAGKDEMNPQTGVPLHRRSESINEADRVAVPHIRRENENNILATSMRAEVKRFVASPSRMVHGIRSACGNPSTFITDSSFNFRPRR